MSDIHKTTKGDVGYAAIKAALSSVPILGSAASELFGLVITPPLDKRRQQWMNEVADKLKELENNNRIDFAVLGENEQFIDTVLHATSIAIKTSEAKKIEALKNAVTNTALDEAPDKSKSQLFLNLIDRFTVWHIKILAFIRDPQEFFKKKGKTPSSLGVRSTYSVLVEIFPYLNRQRNFVSAIWNDLHAVEFHNAARDLERVMFYHGRIENQVTELGEEFLRLISVHEG